MSLFNLTNKVALITGASSGLGLHFAKVLARQGANVAIAARRMDKLETAAKEIAHLGVRCIPIQCDVSQEQEIKELVNTVTTTLGTIDILVNNAGVAKGAPSVDISPSDYDYVLNVNSRAVFLLAREAAKVMLPKKYGRIINIASMYGLVGNKFSPSASYHVSKGSVVNMTRALAAEWSKQGVTVNAICPGFFVSEMTEKLISDEAFMTFVKNSCCLERLGNLEELDTALVFLAANTSSYITGQMIVVDGGWTCI